MPDKAYEEARSLWEKYRVLTHELMKFIDEEEVDTFLDLVDQRGQIIEMLQPIPIGAVWILRHSMQSFVRSRCRSSTRRVRG